MKNVGYVELSDGRKLCVEAEHGGRVKVTLIVPDESKEDQLNLPRALDWSAVESRICPAEHWIDPTLAALNAEKTR